MDDPELQAIREARLKQLRQNASPQGSPLPQGLGGASRTGGDGPDPEATAAAQKAAEEQRREQLAVLLDPNARERRKYFICSLKWDEKLIENAGEVENGIIRLMQMGHIRGRVTEQQLIQLLEQADSQPKPGSQKGSIVYQRRKELEDDDDFDFDL